MGRVRHAVLGGTFDHLHVGHEALLATAFRVGRSVSIGLTTEAYLAEHPKPFPRELEPYRRRRANLERWLRSHYPARRWRLVPLENRFGRSVEDGVDALVVSADTVAGGRAVNAERRRLGRSRLPLVIVPVALADDLEPVSSRRIRAGTIDAQGRRRAPLEIRVAVELGADLPAIVAALAAAFPAPRVRAARSPRVSSRARTTARARHLAESAIDGADLGIGVARAARGSGAVAVRSAGVGLPARRFPPGGAGALEGTLLALVRPDLGRKVFVRPPTSRQRWRRTSG